jgi:hypothetical protein
VDIRNSVLRWDDSGIQAMNNRVGSSVPIRLDGGAIDYISRSGTDGSITLGSLTLAGGASVLRVNVGNSGIGTATMNLSSMTRSTGSTVTFLSPAGSMGDNRF